VTNGDSTTYWITGETAKETYKRNQKNKKKEWEKTKLKERNEDRTKKRSTKIEISTHKIIIILHINKKSTPECVLVDETSYRFGQRASPLAPWWHWHWHWQRRAAGLKPQLSKQQAACAKATVNFKVSTTKHLVATTGIQRAAARSNPADSQPTQLCKSDLKQQQPTPNK
jgi:hypothetical protein